MAAVWGYLIPLVVSVLLVHQVQACSEEGRFGPQCAYVCHCSEQCDRSSGQCPGQCVQPWSGPSCQRENVAYNKTANSSGVYEIEGLWSESKAVDGNRSQYVYAGECFHSSKYSPPNSGNPAREAWFYLDLGRQYRTHSITLYSRERDDKGYTSGPSRLNNTRLTVSDTPNDRNNPCFTFTGHSSRGDNIVDLTCDREGRYVTLYTNHLPPDGDFVAIEICELEVYVCSNGTYGDSCDKLCHCKDGLPCDDVSGRCPEGCMPGFQGESCNQLCSNGTYGDSCDKLCHCKDSLPCDDVSGRCPEGCMPGFQGESCNQLCASGRFGADCAEECHCRDGSCDPVTGAGCQGRCAAGFLGNTCSSRCQETQFGENCASTCHCGTPGCDAINGTCHVPGCLSGYTGHHCNTVQACSEEGRFGPQCAYVCHCSEQCDRSSGQCPGQCVQPWSGPSCQIENVAYNKTVNSSGIYGTGSQATVSKAVDGDRNQDARTASSCFHSNEYNPPNSSNPSQEAWFYVDLGRQYHTHRITLYGRSRHMSDTWGPSRLNNTRLTVSDTPKDRNNPCFTFTGHSSRGNNIVDLTCDREGRYVTLYTNYLPPAERFVLLEICELEVYVCSNGTYGDSCDKLCHCKDGLPCDDVTGRCPQGCMPGFQGENCNQRCQETQFGENCASTCHCGTPGCDAMNGTCHVPGCLSGYTGHHCNTGCQETQFGENCASTCHCGTPGCDAMNGTCHVPGCLSGYTGHHCNTGCQETQFGENCASTCHCGTPGCDAMNGTCHVPGCLSGYTGHHCNTVCASGRFGADCAEECHCRDGSCDHVTGAGCQGRCAAGFLGNTCSSRCQETQFGENCASTCHCGTPGCDAMTGTCHVPGCLSGYTGHDCNAVCASGRFGADCAEECHCRDGSCDHVTGADCQGRCAAGFLGNTCSSRCQETQFGENCASTCHCGTPGCDAMNGTCHVPGCLSGYTGHHCNTGCQETQFGENCASTCHCGTPGCDAMTGTCHVPGCLSGYTGHHCNTGMAVVGGGVAGGSVLLLLLLAVVFLGCRRRRRRRWQPKEESLYNTTNRPEMEMSPVNISLDAVQSSGNP